MNNNEYMGMANVNDMANMLMQSSVMNRIMTPKHQTSAVSTSLTYLT